MKRYKSAAVAPVLSGLVLLSPLPALAAESETLYQEELLITGIRDDRKSRGATGLDLDVFETPQSLTILAADTIEDFALVDINSMLKMTTGVNVDSTETDRTYFNARGFDITTMHVDSVGLPFGELYVGDLDTAIYEKVEVIRGSNGHITGIGNPSGTINYVRKRPGNEFEMNTRLSTGRWNNQRAVVDISTPLTADKVWAARVVGVYQEKESWLDHYENDRNVVSVVVDGQLGNDVTVAFGYTRQDNNSTGNLWGAVPIIYNNGEQLDYNVSTSSSMPWTYWDTLTETAFVELGWEINDHWHLLSTLTQSDYEEHSELFYVYWYEGVGLDPATGQGLYSYPGKYDDDSESFIADFVLSGSFDAWGQSHELNVGLSMGDEDSESFAHDALGGFVAMPSFPGWTGNEVARPDWAAPYQSANADITLNRLYATFLLSVTDHFKLILGASKVDYENEGISYGVSTDSEEDGTSPYVGFTWEVNEGLNLYGSYSDIYQPQYYLNENLQALGSAEGKSFELGLKKQLGDSLLATLALFKTEQSNLQEFVEYGDGDGIDDTDYSDDFAFALYRGIDVESEGIELELAGQLTDTVVIQAGFTHLKMEDPDGEELRTFIPRNTFKLLTSWNPVWNESLALGFSLRWQDDIYFDSEFGRISQDSYFVAGGYATYQINEEVSLTLNVDNLTDEKYLSSVKYEQSYYASPLNYSLSLDWRF